MQRTRSDCQAPWNREVTVRPSLGLDSHGPRLRMKNQQERVLHDAMR
jgi:hypothetical protein